ncbi:MAG: hypothetical protein AB2L14_33715 [Candidatus Xenobiia bacterium LiM19]
MPAGITVALLVLFIVTVYWITLKTGPVVMTRFNPDPISEIFLPNTIPQLKTSLLLLASFLLISPFTIIVICRNNDDHALQ